MVPYMVLHNYGSVYNIPPQGHLPYSHIKHTWYFLEYCVLRYYFFITMNMIPIDNMSNW